VVIINIGDMQRRISSK